MSIGSILTAVRKRYEALPDRDRGLVCADGFHMECDVLKLRKGAWTNDDPTQITSPTGGIFFSIWVSGDGARDGRASYNIHSYGHYKLKQYRIASKEFCRDFRDAFEPLRHSWPHVSTEFRSQTLMEGWYAIDEKTFPQDTLKLMHQFDNVAAIIDHLLKLRTKGTKRGRGAVA